MRLKSLLAACGVLVGAAAVAWFSTHHAEQPATTATPADRVLVDKAFRFSTPSRWDEVVFGSPLERPRNFIKRMQVVPANEVEVIPK